MNEILFQIILGVISILGAILTGIIVPFVKEKIGNEKLAKYEQWASMAVECAEMLFKEQGMGEQKKQYVVDFLNKTFNKNRVVITPQQIEVLVEAAVKSMKLQENAA